MRRATCASICHLLTYRVRTIAQRTKLGSVGCVWFQPVRCCGVAVLCTFLNDVYVGGCQRTLLRTWCVGCLLVVAAALRRQVHARSTGLCRLFSVLAVLCEVASLNVPLWARFGCVAWAWCCPTFGPVETSWGPSEFPNEIVGLLLSVLGDRKHVNALLDQEWVSEWHGWRELDRSSDRSCMDIARRLLQISSATGHSVQKSNPDRLLELSMAGWRVQAASPRHANNCLLDALLITLAEAGCLPQSLATQENTRREACAACRKMLTETDDFRLRPRQLSTSGQVMDVTESEHNSAYLQSDLHGPAAVRFFLDFYRRSSRDVRSVRVVVYTRYDCPMLDPSELSVLVPVAPDAPGRDVIVSLYCHMDRQGNGFHYDALLPVADRPEQELENRAGNDAQSGVMDVASASDSEEEGPRRELARQVPVPPGLQATLQKFLDMRCSSPVKIATLDVERVWQAWDTEIELGRRLATLLQAGLTYADSGTAAAVRLAKAFRAYQKLQAKQQRFELHSRRTAGPNVSKGESSRGAVSKLSKPGQEEGPAQTASTGLPRSIADAGAEACNPCPRRLSGKQASEAYPSPEQPDFDEFVVRAMPSEQSPDPRAAFEHELTRVAALLLPEPLLPETEQGASAEAGARDLPAHHCAFRKCGWEGDSEHELRVHLSASHQADLSRAAACLQGSGTREEAVFSSYSAAVTVKCQQGAPLACNSIDRRCLREFHAALSHPDLGSVVCFVCARRFPHDGVSQDAEINWHTLGGGSSKIMGRSPAELEAILGLQTYREKYVPGDEGLLRAAATMHEELGDWRAEVTCEGTDLELLCCPEDIRCDSCKNTKQTLCEQCEVPMCRYCYTAISCHGRKPQQALSNDLMIYYAPRELYELDVTFMEMICASPCLTTMACFSLEKKYRNERVMDATVQNNARRIAARGNATTFPLPWEQVLAQLQGLDETREGTVAPALPRTGEDLSDFVTVLLKSCDEEITEESLRRLLHAATVRRAVVVKLIENACARGHRAFRAVCMEDVHRRAAALPENGVPSAVRVLLPYDEDLDYLQPQKNATPSAPPGSLETVQARMRDAKPNAVVLEKSCALAGDANAQGVDAICVLAQQTHGAGVCGSKTSSMQGLEITTGSRMLDQFEPWYFGVAFAYLFKYCAGLPDAPEWSGKPRWRRKEDEPRVGLGDWVRIMSRRIESQLGRDWVFGFASWNVLFRSAVNLSRTVYVVNTPVYDAARNSWGRLTTTDLEKASLELLTALTGRYTDRNGRAQQVNGDMTKLGRVQDVSSTAKKILRSITQTAQLLPGTQEARRHMRHDIEAMRVRYGLPIFVTFSPDEAHQLLFVRLCRTRQSDPGYTRSASEDAELGGRRWPQLCDDLHVPVAKLIESTRACPPDWWRRRGALARDPLASVDGFRMLVTLALRHLFGVRFCWNCPECGSKSSSCQDLCGSNAAANGGVFGRADGIYVAIEAQKSSGSLHAHAQVFIQCLHQRQTLADVWREVEARAETLASGYLRYSTHVMRGVYGAPLKDVDESLETLRESWPEYQDDVTMITRPAYLLKRRAATEEAEAEAKAWTRDYLLSDVLSLQLRKQHHVHKLDSVTGETKPLSGCRRKDKPELCKADFPRTAWLTAEAHVLCPCTLSAFGMPQSGRKNRLGSMHGPYGHEWLNPTHPALLAGLRCNSDVQLPYRLPILCAACRTNLPTEHLRKQALLAAQRAQDAQTGYACDYCSKSQPMAYKEIQEFRKGHQQLHEKFGTEAPQKLGRRHVSRFLSDAYCKGVVRGQVECCNLRASYREDYAVAAECMRTSRTVSFMGAQYLGLVEQLVEGRVKQARAKVCRLNRRQPRGRRKLDSADTAVLYALRPTHPDIWFLSPYEFTMCWDIVPTRVPQTREEAEDPTAQWDVTLQPCGLDKLRAASDGRNDLLPGVDYTLARASAGKTIVFDDVPECSQLRHSWLLRRRPRSVCPHFGFCPTPRRHAEHREENARVTAVYFRPWTLRVAVAEQHVPVGSQLREGSETWEEALRQWLNGNILSQEARNHVANFLSVYRVRPTEAEEAGNSDDAVSDADVQLETGDLREVFGQSAAGAPNELEEKVCQPRKQEVFETACLDANKTWGAADENATATSALPNLEYDLAAAKKAARQSRQRGNAHAKINTNESQHEASVKQTATRNIEVEIARWLEDVSTRCNKEQHGFLRMVAERVLQEEAGTSTRGHPVSEDSEPLRWVLHGGPGTGKSHVLRLLKQDLFETVLGWRRGVEFEVVALQASMADALEGDTIHHALSLAVFRDEEEGSLKKQMDLAHRALRWRWLLLDEISMVSAELLARLEMKCREIVRDGCRQKRYERSHMERPFGGLNVLLSGDLWQLEPPSGTFLGTLPTALLEEGTVRRGPTTAYGQLLVWGGAEHGVQGVTELVTCERTTDLWLQEVQAQIRVGNLDADSHAFLHGEPTSVPGSWLQNDVQCGSATCRKLKDSCSPRQIREKECKLCAHERETRRRVARGPTDAECRLQFSRAAAIFATNDIKHHVNKVRAAAFAREQLLPLVLLPAKDYISAPALREKPDLKKCKKQWLKRHDRNCGGLYGVLPLCVGMPVRLTEHLDRGEKSLLKGRVGTVKGWQSETGVDIAPIGSMHVFRKTPDVIWVDFADAATTWQLDGVPATAVYPVQPRRAAWFLDQGRKRPVLRISRLQMPLAPAFALTAHSAQGMTLDDGVILDCVLPPGGNIITVYIAITRVRERAKLLIARPFPLADFQKGLRGARDLLLDCWRGQAPDWDSIRARFNTTKKCVDCLQDKRKTFFTKPQWRACDKTRVCKECVAWHKDKKEPWRCSHCLQWQAAACFRDASKSNNATWTRICSACSAARRCTRCAQLRINTEFSKKQWARTNRFCLQCAHKGKRQRTPKACLNASCIARARNFIDRSRKRMCLRAIKREIARLRERKEHSSKSATQNGEVGAQAGADVATPKKRAKAPQTRTDRSPLPLFAHSCPTCGATVQSRLASGRIRIKHERPDGLPCERQSWHVLQTVPGHGQRGPAAREV